MGWTGRIGPNWAEGTGLRSGFSWAELDWALDWAELGWIGPNQIAGGPGWIAGYGIRSGLAGPTEGIAWEKVPNGTGGSNLDQEATSDDSVQPKGSLNEVGPKLQ
ncbi:hypothetical protein CDL15_Pgr010267 [Punica granatum]|uniref:Uncharacterized protein n=1 Tax=Punica granatum TaxID=22663 RepID=A0A218VV41_PUNGR|nr:hypothetical protein CDL15_Pgr010267 [Punica granatum]PKI37246.1 hypothetical protein CRG98_042360 [Punica granatum]